MSDEDVISPYNVNTISSRKVVRIREKVSVGRLLVYPIF